MLISRSLRIQTMPDSILAVSVVTGGGGLRENLPMLGSYKLT